MGANVLRDQRLRRSLPRGNAIRADAQCDDVVSRAEVERSRRPSFRLRRLVFVAVATYVLVSILVGVFQRHLIYFPTSEYEAVPTDVGLAYEDVTFTAQDGVRLAGWYIPHAKAAGTVLFFHGNAGNISHRLPTIQQLHMLGYNVFIFDYRGYGQSTGKPGEAGLYHDAEAALRYLTDERSQTPDRIAYCGRSLGGAVAIELATRHPPGALIVESTFTRLADVGKIHYPWLPVSILLGDAYDSVARIGDVRCPKLFLHGADDQLIPIALGRALYEAATEPKRFVETPGGHNDAGFTYSPSHAAMVGAFLDDEMGQ